MVDYFSCNKIFMINIDLGYVESMTFLLINRIRWIHVIYSINSNACSWFSFSKPACCGQGQSGAFEVQIHLFKKSLEGDTFYDYKVIYDLLISLNTYLVYFFFVRFGERRYDA